MRNAWNGDKAAMHAVAFFGGLSQEQLEIHTVQKFLKARIRS
jgi:hypothetical protein